MLKVKNAAGTRQHAVPAAFLYINILQDQIIHQKLS